MNIFDIITLAIFGITIIICIWRGFLKILLKLGAVVIAAIAARFLGPMLGETLIPELISWDRFSPSTQDVLNQTLSSFIGTLAVFIVLFVLLRIISGILSKIITKITHTSKLDRILGAVFGFVVAFGLLVIFAKLVDMFAAVVTFVNPDTAIFDTIDESLLFKYFR